MKLKKGELKIFYKVPGKVNEELEISMENILQEYGYRRWASGINATTNTRDLAFELAEEGKSET